MAAPGGSKDLAVAAPILTLERLSRALAVQPAGLALDFDGTLSAIAARPEQARPLPGVREALRALAPRLAAVAIISGRPISQLLELVGLPELIYAGNHGVEWWRDRQLSVDRPSAAAVTQLALARDALRLAVNGAPGLRLEDKGSGLSLHYRQSSRPAQAHETALALARRLAGDQLAILEGRRVIELRAVPGADKGTAMRRLARESRLRSLVYFGDDATDLQAFQALEALNREAGLTTLSVAVLNSEAVEEVAAGVDATLAGPEAAADLLTALASSQSSRPSPERPAMFGSTG